MKNLFKTLLVVAATSVQMSQATNVQSITIDETIVSSSDLSQNIITVRDTFCVDSLLSNEEVKVGNADSNENVFEVVDQMPSFPGGTAALMQWLSNHIKYPKEAEDEEVQGRVICTFVVEKDGSISNVRVVRSVAPSLDKEAVRVLKAMPKWIPGKHKGESVRVKYLTPVTFRYK